MNVAHMDVGRFVVFGMVFLVGSCAGPKLQDGSGQSVDLSVAVNPSRGQGADALFSIACSSGTRSPVRELRLLIKSAIDGRKACYVYYDRATNAFALVKDEGSGSTSLPAGNMNMIENSQCSLDGAKSGGKVDANTALIQVAIHFKPSFAGEKNIYTYGEDISGSNTGLVSRGRWVVPPGASSGPR